MNHYCVSVNGAAYGCFYFSSKTAALVAFNGFSIGHVSLFQGNYGPNGQHGREFLIAEHFGDE